jgi:hypothetical protein
MEPGEATKASNAVVAVADFYGTALADVVGQLREAKAALALVTKHSKAQATEVETQGQRLAALAVPVRALLQSGRFDPSSDQLLRELWVTYERTIGPVRNADEHSP